MRNSTDAPGLQCSVPGVRSEPGKYPPVQHRVDAAYAALPLLERLRDRLKNLEARLLVQRKSPNRWKVPPLFFFHPRSTVSELPAARRSESLSRVCRVVNWDSTVKEPRGRDDLFRIAPELPSLIAEASRVLTASVQVRHMARAVPGLQVVARSFATFCPELQNLAAILDVPDDVIVRVINPFALVAIRIRCQGISLLGELQRYLAECLGVGSRQSVISDFLPDMGAVAGDAFGNHPDDDSVELLFQCYDWTGIRADGRWPAGFAGVDRWLWEWCRLSELPRVDGERILVIGPPVYPRRWLAPAGLPIVTRQVQVLQRYSAVEVRAWIAENLGEAFFRDDSALTVSLNAA